MVCHIPAAFYPAYKKAEPIFIIEPGQPVVTITLDAHGMDEHGKQRVEFSNPLTGPFLLENAAIGDSIVVEIHSIKPLGGHGWSYAYPRPWLMERPDAEEFSEKKIIEWEVNCAAGYASPAHWMDGKMKIPIRPMLGCVGVARESEKAVTSQQAGLFGGNLDFPLLTAGARLEIPVGVSGAYLYIGDAHAVQFAGEMTGAAVEVPAEVEFSVRLKKGTDLHWLRGETPEFLFTLGCGKPLETAIQHATSEMIRQLQDGYGLVQRDAAAVTGQCGEFQICNLVNPVYTAACMISKTILSTLI
jgi:acetamidase/formamidase